MADQSISEMISADQIRDTDLFLLEQGGDAKSLAGRVLLNWLTAAADGHGGIQSIDPVSSSGLVDTYRITLADTTTADFTVTNGRSITGTTKTGTSGLVDTYQITFNAGPPVTFTVTNGAKGDKGDNAHTWVKYASQEPTDASHSMGDIPDAWRGEYTGTAATAPTDWKRYKWYKIKGDKGDTGDPARLVSSSTTYMVSDSGTIIPSGSWQSTVPTVPQGKYLWTRVITSYNSGDPVTSYSVSRMGLDGTGAVNTVNDQSPDSNGNVKVTAADIATGSGESIQAELDEKVATVNGQVPDGSGAVTLTPADVGAVSASNVLTFEEIQASTDLTGKVPGAQAIKSLQKRLVYGKFLIKAEAGVMKKIVSSDDILSGTLPPRSSFIAFACQFSSQVDPNIGLCADSGYLYVKPAISQPRVEILWVSLG